MATLTNTKIKDTYDGLLKTTDNEALDVSGVTLIEDGLGNASALSVGRSGNGVTITGSLNATLATAAQPNITSVGTLSSLTTSGDVTVGNDIYVSNGNFLKLQRSSGGLYLDVLGNESGTDDIRFLSSGNFKFVDGSLNELVRISSNGNVGIGTDSISAPLDVRRGDTSGVVAEFHNSTGYGIDVGSSESDAYISSGYLQNFIFKTNSGSGQTERMRIDSSGNVGIGATPNTSYSRLQVKATDSVYALDLIGRNAGTEGEAQITFWNSAQSTVQGYITQDNGNMLFGAGIGATERMRIDSSGNVRLSGTAPSAEDTISKIDFYNNSSSINLAGIEGKRTAGGTNYGSLIFNTTNSGTSSEKMRIDSSGNVGIGIAPSSKLGIFSSGGYSVFSSGKSVNGIDIQGTAGGSGNYASGISFGVGGVGRAAISAVQNSADSDVVGLAFFTHGSSTGSADAAERMRIGSDGAVFMYDIIGFSGTNSDVRYDTASGQIYYLTSSERYKSEITSLEDSLGKVNALRPVRFKDNYSEQYTTGLIAEEVVDVIPEVVFKKEIEGYEEPQPEGVNYSDLTPFLIKAIQELSAKVAALESQLNA